VPPSVMTSGRGEPRRSGRWELISCARGGHVLVGTDAAELRPEDALVAMAGPTGLGPDVRWHRCLRCDTWIPRSRPNDPSRRYPPDRDEIILPLRGRPLRDRYVLRLIAVDRLVHVLLLATVGVLLLVVAGNQADLHTDFDRIVNALQAGGGAPVSRTGLLGTLTKVFRVTPTHLRELAAVVLAYGVLELVEMVGLWRTRRWAEYLTFVATTALVPFEVYELSKSVSALKLLTLVLNLVIVVYLLLAKRLFGLRGGGRAERAEGQNDNGWEALERATPWLRPRPDA
jgi:uncharacterized membrane protein (DUF2068 family)